jgi:hypothetical protein
MSTRLQSKIQPNAEKNPRPRRHQLKWSINEILRLQREYELLELNTKQIAVLHERSEVSIINKLKNEGWIEHTEDARRG